MESNLVALVGVVLLFMDMHVLQKLECTTIHKIQAHLVSKALTIDFQRLG